MNNIIVKLQFFIEKTDTGSVEQHAIGMKQYTGKNMVVVAKAIAHNVMSYEKEHGEGEVNFNVILFDFSDFYHGTALMQTYATVGSGDNFVMHASTEKKEMKGVTATFRCIVQGFLDRVSFKAGIET